MSESPKVSVVIPTYNRAALLPRAVESVLAQTYHDFELLIVDDGSADDTPQVVAAFTNPRVRLIRHEANKGISATLNTGIANARGEYITFLENDNELTPNSLACRLGALESAPPDVALAYGYLDFINDRTGERTEDYRFAHEGSEALEASLRFEDFTGIGSFLAHTSAVREIGGFDERIRMGMDIFFMCSFQLKYSIVAMREVVGVVHREHGYIKATHWSKYGNVVADVSIFRQHFAAEVARRPGLQRYLARDMPGLFWRNGAVRAMREGAILSSLGFVGQAVKAHPRTIRNLKLPLHLVKGFLFYATPLRRLRRPLQHLVGQRV